MTEVELADDAYEQAEAAFLAAIRANADRDHVTSLSADLAARSDEWNSAAYRALHASEGDERYELDLLTERTEVLSELWADIHTAYQG